MDPLIERFIEVWGTPERGRRLWQEWRDVLGERNSGVLDTLAQLEIDTSGLSLEDAQNRLALQKFAEDRGSGYVLKVLRHHDAQALRATHTLKTMVVAKAKKR